MPSSSIEDIVAQIKAMPHILYRTDLTDWASLKVHMQLSNDPGQSQVMADTDIKVRVRMSVGSQLCNRALPCIWLHRRLSCSMCTYMHVSMLTAGDDVTVCRGRTGMHS